MRTEVAESKRMLFAFVEFLKEGNSEVIGKTISIT